MATETNSINSESAHMKARHFMLLLSVPPGKLTPQTVN